MVKKCLKYFGYGNIIPALWMRKVSRNNRNFGCE